MASNQSWTTNTNGMAVFIYVEVVLYRVDVAIIVVRGNLKFDTDRIPCCAEISVWNAVESREARPWNEERRWQWYRQNVKGVAGLGGGRRDYVGVLAERSCAWAGVRNGQMLRLVEPAAVAAVLG